MKYCCCLINNPVAAAKNSRSFKNVKPDALSAFLFVLPLQVPLRSSDHHQRLEHGKECSTRVVKRNENKRRKNGRNSSSERDNCIIQNGGGTLDVGDRVAIKLSSRMDEEETFRNHIGQWWWWWW